MFHVRRRPADSQPRRRKKKPLGTANGTNNMSTEREGPVLVEVTHSGDGGRRIKLGSDPIEVGSANTNCLQLFGPSIQPRHCLISLLEGVCTVTPLHTDALTFVNGHHITQPTILHNGSVVMFGRVASYRFVDSPTDGRYNLALSQSQLDSACLYESRSPTSPGSWNDDEGALSSTHKSEYEHQHGGFHNNNNNNNNNNNANNNSGGTSEHSMNLRDGDNENAGPPGTKLMRAGGVGGDHSGSQHFDSQSVEGNLENETKSISSLKSAGSNSQERSPKLPGGLTMPLASGDNGQGQEPILPAVLEFPETHQELFLRHIISELDVNAPHFKLAPVYSLYLCARYRASTHYRPELQPTERAHKLTIFLHHVANLIYSVVQEQQDPRILAFWMANSSEFLHFLKSDRHISAFSVQAQEVLAESVQTAFRNLVNCFRVELAQTLNQFLSETIDHDSAAGLVLTVLGSAMALLRRCRVNAALTIQLFSQLFHYINVICFNTIVANSHMCTADWGKVMTERLQLLESWAERQGLELAADCHLAKINQCAQFLQAPKTTVEEIQQLACSCFRLNSLQMAALLQQEKIPRNLVDTAIRMAESVADELTRADGREVRLEESPELHLALLLPDDGFSCDVVRGIPSGLVDFINPLQQQGMCRLAAQPTSIGMWTVYMHQFNARSSSAMSNKLPQPEMQTIKLHKNSNGMGLSIVAAKGAGQERLGIYIKSVVPGGAADADGRLQAGDQLLRVDGQSLIGITQERAADYLVRTGTVVTLDVAKQGAIYHGLATLLQQPSPVIQRGNRRMSERDLTRMGADSKSIGSLIPNTHLPNSKSVPALHHHSGSGTISMANAKSRSTHSLANSSNPMGGVGNEQGFYQNLSVYRSQNQSQPILTDRPQMPLHTGINAFNGSSPHSGPNPLMSSMNGGTTSQPSQPGGPHHHLGSSVSSNMPPSRPVSAYYHSGGPPATTTGGPLQQQQQQQQQPPQQQQPQQQFAHHSHNSNNNISASSSNLNGGSMQPNAAAYQQQLGMQQQQQPHLAAHLGPHSSLTMGNRSKSTQNFNRDMQAQHSLRMQQMMAPSMPNISNMYHQQQQQQHPHQQQQQQPASHQHQPSMLSSQSMQNVNLSSSGGGAPGDMQQFLNGSSLTAEGYQQQMQHSPAAQSLRRNPRHDLIGGGMDNMQHSPNQMMQQQLLQQQQQQQQQAMYPLPPKPGAGGSQQQLSPNKQQQQQMPPTAPKPQQQQQQRLQQQQQQYMLYQQQQQQHQQQLEDKPPLPPTTTHPLYKPVQQLTAGMNYVASTLDPPKGGYVPVNRAPALQKGNFMGTNPWEREEREKEVEMRREHIRQWREQQIAELSAVPQRSGQQEEQLKTLILERDFERRVAEIEEQEDESETSYEKDNVQEVYRLAQQANAIQTPVTSFRQTEIKISSVLDNLSNGHQQQQQPPPHHMSQADDIATLTHPSELDSPQQQQQQNAYAPPPLPANPPPAGANAAATATANPAPVMQPKSILKNNRYDNANTAPSSPSKSQKSASFADDRHLHTEHHIWSMSKDLAQMGLGSPTGGAAAGSPSEDALTNGNGNAGNNNNSVVPPPPPPERNSSYLIMSQQKMRSSGSSAASASSAMGLLKTATSNSASDALMVNQKPKAGGILMGNNNNNINNNMLNNNINNNGSGGSNNNGNNASPVGSSLASSSAASHHQSLEMLSSGGIGSGSSYSLLRDNKRVSFHDEDNNYVSSTSSQQQMMMAEHLYGSENQAPSDLDTIREDSSSYLQQSMDSSMLPSMPATPDAALWNTTVQSTPGVIGAQEVYRDPRTRRLAEKQQLQQQRNTEAVPEKLSFKEKMKMFTLESGEHNTPKEKLKISRAQRDIDAVH